MASPGSLGCPTASSCAASDRVSDSGVREIWSTAAIGPWPANRVTVFCPGSKPRSTLSGGHPAGRPSSSSAKHHPTFDGAPSAARSIPP